MTAGSQNPTIVRTTVERLSPWFTVVEREVARGTTSVGTFHSVRQADYVSVLALTAAREVILVRQYRSAWEKETLELPGGLLEPGENPGVCAQRELAEEAGMQIANLQLLGSMMTDTGRLENRIWCYFASDVRPLTSWTPEPNVSRHLIPLEEFISMVTDGSFDHALHVAIVGLARLKRLI